MAGRTSALSPRFPSVAVLQLSQAAIAALAVCTGRPEGRFAALVLLALLILTRAAARDMNRVISTLAVASLGGVLLSGVFPGLVLVVLALTNYDAWLVVPLGVAAIPILAASLPERFPKLSLADALPSIGWLPLLLALLIGYFTPDAVTRWCQILTAGQP
jgi:hypothetical protein